MRKEEFQNILKKYRQGLCTPEEQALIDKWFKAMGSWEDPSLDHLAKAEIRNRSWNNIRARIDESKPKSADEFAKRRTLHVSSRRIWAFAACIAIVAISVVLIIQGPEPANDLPSNRQALKRTILNDTKTEMEVRLHDGSRVLLKPESKLVFSEPFAAAQRIVYLDGEAFFDVSRDTLHPFVVHTKEVITKVLGTSFTVSAFADDDNITVSVMTGKVSVMTRNDKDSATTSLKETILTPNQKIIYNRSNNIVSRGILNEPLPILPAETVKRMHFEAAPIKDIFTALEEVYGVDIVFDEHTFSSCILTTSIAEGSIYNRLDMICKAIDAQYVIKENHIVVAGAGCDH